MEILWELVFWGGLVVSLGVGFLYFRELGDISQMFFRVKRANLVRAIRHEYKMIALGGIGAAAMVFAHLVEGAGTAWVFWPAIAVLLLFYGFSFVWLHIGMRHQSRTARYFPIEEARAYVSPSNGVLVIENKGSARAHPDGHLLRPHIVGNKEGFKGDDVVMTYCGMSNLGLAYKPEIGGKAVDLEVMAQIGNNLILRDNNSGEPVQQILGQRECEIGKAAAMEPWPTFRMTFRGFEKAYPDGEVFLNLPTKNPLLKILDTLQDMMFTWGITAQHRVAAPVIDNMTRADDRLPNKTYVWGVNIGEDAVCYTDDFLIQQGQPVNAVVGGRAIVVDYDQRFESIGIWYNDYEVPITVIDIYGRSEQGVHSRVETLKPGMFWHVWVEYFPHTDINRVGDAAEPREKDARVASM